MEGDYALYTCGNRLILFDAETNSIFIDQKVVNDAIMVITDCPLSENILLCTYDGKPY